MQFEVGPASVGPRVTRYFSAPGFNSGPPAAAPPPPRPPRPPAGAAPAAGAAPLGALKSYTPERSALPSGIRGRAFATSTAAPFATGVVPATVTVTSFVSVVLPGPVTVSV